MRSVVFKCKYFQYHQILFLVIILFLPFLCRSQTPVRAMVIHYNDGSTYNVPIPFIDSISFDTCMGNDLEPVKTDSVSSNEVLQRAYQMASVVWTPLRPVPKRGGGFYEPDQAVNGVPYSSVKEIHTYLFQDVSYYTFMTAVHNPNSVLYTEDISQLPYHGTNCAPYYGAVCSSSVMWALGFDVPYSSSNIINLPDFTCLDYQIIDSLKICDVIWKPGHVQMIYAMEYSADTLCRIKTFETTYAGAHINDYTSAQFRGIWNSCGYVGYRYSKLIYSNEPVVIQEWEPITYNNDLCPSKGDRAVYRTIDTVTINIYNANYERIVLAKGFSLISSDNYSDSVFQYHNLQPGIYTVFLQRDENKSAKVSFEIVEAEVSCVLNDDGENIDIFFHSSATPMYVSLCDISGGLGISYIFSDVDRWRGYITVPRRNNMEYYCRIIFKGEFGSIINVPIRVE